MRADQALVPVEVVEALRRGVLEGWLVSSTGICGTFDTGSFR